MPHILNGLGGLDGLEVPETADAIFVFAGRESRKRFGLRLFREGVANRLVLSVGRFEWRRFASLGLPSDGGLVEMVGKIEPRLRHFFVVLRPEGASCEAIQKGVLGTWSEARALSDLVGRERIGKLVVVSHRQHLKRCLLALSLTLPDPCTVTPIASPADDSTEPPSDYLTEVFKLITYSALLAPLQLGQRFDSSRLRGRRIPAIKTRFTLSQPGLREGEFRPPDAASAPSPPGAAADGRSHD